MNNYLVQKSTDCECTFGRISCLYWIVSQNDDLGLERYVFNDSNTNLDNWDKFYSILK